LLALEQPSLPLDEDPLAFGQSPKDLHDSQMQLADPDIKLGGPLLLIVVFLRKASRPYPGSPAPERMKAEAVDGGPPMPRTNPNYASGR
jgi:hypothetical protein